MPTKTANAVRVSRDGTVTRDGVKIGSVRREMRQGLFLAGLGVRVGLGDGTPWWVPVDANGTDLSDGFDTRKRAVSLVEKNAQPLTITDVKTEDGWSGRFVSAWVAYRGYSFSVSRYASESDWIIDAYFTPSGLMPVFSNGSGARYGKHRVLSDAVAEKVTDSAIEAGVWPMA